MELDSTFLSKIATEQASRNRFALRASVPNLAARPRQLFTEFHSTLGTTAALPA